MNVANITQTRQNITDKDLPEIWKEAKEKKVEYLDLSYNKGTIEHLVIPSGLKHLRHLYLYQSNIKKITLEGDMQELVTLHLGDNAIEEFHLPSGFAKMEHLRLDNNKLKSFIIDNINGLDKMKSLFLKGNQIENISKEMWSNEENCWDKVSAFLQAGAASSGWVINNEAKVIWLGNGLVGKTTLSHQLREGKFKAIATNDRTHGIDIQEWTIKYKDLPDSMKYKIEDAVTQTKRNNKNEEIEIPEEIHLKMWDFGGQEYYHATHRLFLNNNVMYLLVWDEETEKQTSVEVGGLELEIYPKHYWKSNIDYYAKKEKTVLEIQNKVGKKYSIEDAEKQFIIRYRDEDNERSKNAYNINVEELKDGILDNLCNLDYLSKPFPKVYAHIREKISNHPDYLMSFSNFREFCARHDLTKSGDKIMSDDNHMETLTTFLHDTGNIICYHYDKEVPENLRDYVFLDPKWVTDTIYDILDKKVKTESGGEFNMAHVAKQTQNSSELSPEDWVGLMKVFKLIFEIEKKDIENPQITEIRYVAPQYLPKECREKRLYHKWLRDTKPVHAFTLHFPTFLPKSLFLKFIVEYGPQCVDFTYWKSGLLFEINEITVLALCDYDNGKISISIEGNDEMVKSEIYRWFTKQREFSDEIGVSLDADAKDGYKIISELMLSMKPSKEDQLAHFYHQGKKCEWSEYRFMMGDFRDFGGQVGMMDIRGVKFDTPPKKKSEYYENGYALFIGIAYKNWARLLRPLGGTIRDVESLEKHFLDKQKAAFNPRNIVTLKEDEATTEGIFNALDEIAEKTKDNPDAFVLVSYSGHGETDGKNNFLVPYDFDFDRWRWRKDFDEKHVVLAKDFSKKIAAIQAKKTLIILDCCHAENIPISKDLEPSQGFLEGFVKDLEPSSVDGVKTKGLADEMGKGSGRVILTSCQSDEKSLDLGHNGLFTEVFLECLEGKGNIDNDGWVTLLDLMRYVPKTVSQRAVDMNYNQNPVFSSIENLRTGDFIISAYDIAMARSTGTSIKRQPIKPDISNLIQLLEVDNMPELFEEMGKMATGSNKGALSRFRKEYQSGNYKYDFHDRLRIFINNLK